MFDFFVRNKKKRYKNLSKKKKTKLIQPDTNVQVEQLKDWHENDDEY